MSLNFFHRSHNILPHIVFSSWCWFCEITGLGQEASPFLDIHPGGREESSRALQYLGWHFSSSSHIALSLQEVRVGVSSSTWRDSLTFSVIRTLPLWFNLRILRLISCIQLYWIWGYLWTSKIASLKFYEQWIIYHLQSYNISLSSLFLDLALINFYIFISSLSSFLY